VFGCKAPLPAEGTDPGRVGCLPKTDDTVRNGRIRKRPDKDNLQEEPLKEGARGSVVVKALCYKPEGRGFETR
jgi:hypothetical protein